MRERLALLVCGLTLVLVTGLSWRFAVRQNPAVAGIAPVAPAVAPQAVPEAVPEAGPGEGARQFRELGCSSCHAIAGAGNPRRPLDGVGVRRSREELRAWTTGTGPAAEELSPMVRRRKERYGELSDAEMNRLLDFLAASGERREGGGARNDAEPR